MATSTTAEQIIDVVTPAAGESVTEGTILEWHAKVGDPIKLDDTIVEISTDKVDVELPSPATGTVSEILAQEGDTVTVGQVIARIVVGGASQNGAPASNGAPADSSTSDGAAGDRASSDGTSGGLPDGVKVSPVAARAAAVEDHSVVVARQSSLPPTPSPALPSPGRSALRGAGGARRCRHARGLWRSFRQR